VLRRRSTVRTGIGRRIRHGTRSGLRGLGSRRLSTGFGGFGGNIAWGRFGRVHGPSLAKLRHLGGPAARISPTLSPARNQGKRGRVARTAAGAVAPRSTRTGIRQMLGSRRGIANAPYAALTATGRLLDRRRGSGARWRSIVQTGHGR
jgi:hypothetical protein